MLPSGRPSHALGDLPGPIHDTAARGFAADADRYAYGRPDYPRALDGWLRKDVGLGPDSTVVDLGAGTGKFIPRLQSTGAAVIGIEPLPLMRARLCADYPRVDARSGTADAIPLPDAAVDAVVCAQSFHWFATTEALAEIARVLRPGGVLALVWNVRDTSVPWVARLTDIAARYEGDTPRYHSGDWRRAFPAPRFGPLVEKRFDHAHVGSPEAVVVQRFLSVSFIAALPADERATVEERLRALIDSEPMLAGRETVSMPYRTDAFCCVRAG